MDVPGLGDMRVALGDVKGASQELERVLALDPEDRKATEKVIEIGVKLGAWDHVAMWEDRLLQLVSDPDERAVVLDAPGPPEALQIRKVPVPSPDPGQVLIKVEAFGLNRSELHTRLGLADGVTFPRVLGIEAVGTVVSCPGGELAPGEQVAALMGGMGRTFDGGYAEYTCVPVRQTVPFASELAWATLGAVPEMLRCTTAGACEQRSVPGDPDEFVSILVADYLNVG